MEIDHLTIPVWDYSAGKRFYERALAPLGFSLTLDWPDRRRAYFGLAGEPASLWVCESAAAGSLAVSLAVRDGDQVRAFHEAATAAGARSADEPGFREQYAGDYYAARVHDRDGNSVEAVFRKVARSERLAA